MDRDRNLQESEELLETTQPTLPEQAPPEDLSLEPSLETASPENLTDEVGLETEEGEELLDGSELTERPLAGDEEMEGRMIGEGRKQFLRLHQLKEAGREAVHHVRWLMKNDHPPPPFMRGSKFPVQDVFNRRVVLDEFFDSFLTVEEKNRGEVTAMSDTVEFGREVRRAGEA